MTTNSFAASIRFAKSMLKERRPDLEIKHYAMRKIGRLRLAQITLATGEYQQFPLAPLGTHHAQFVGHIVAAIEGMRKPPAS